MSKQPEALRLADALETYGPAPWANSAHQAAAELRRLHEENERLKAQQQEPYGQVTVVRRPGCVDQHWFYRWPEPPYLDNAAECHTVYTSPPASKPLTDAQIGAVAADIWGSVLIAPQSYQAFARAIEAAHGIKGGA